MRLPTDLEAQAAATLADRTGVARHDAVVVLGSGWDAAADVLGTPVSELSVSELPGFLAPVAPGHRGLVRSYRLDGLAVLAYLGRTHLYEGHGPAPVAHPVRVAAAAGARLAVLTNANGSLRADWPPGTGALIADHLNLTFGSPLSGPEFVDLTDAWSPRLRAVARSADPDAGRGGLRAAARAVGTDGGRDRMLRMPRRRPGRHVDGRRGDRRARVRPRAAGTLDRHDRSRAPARSSTPMTSSRSPRPPRGALRGCCPPSWRRCGTISPPGEREDGR